MPRGGELAAGLLLCFRWTSFYPPAPCPVCVHTRAPSRHSMCIGVQSVIKRLQIMIAPVFGGMLIDRFGIVVGVRIALLISIFLSGLTILVQRQWREEPIGAAQGIAEFSPAAERWNVWRSLRELNQPMRRLLL